MCAEYNISQQTFYNWKRKFGEMDISEARRLRALEEENTRLKRLVADLSVQNDLLKEGTQKSGEVRRQSVVWPGRRLSNARARPVRRAVLSVLPAQAITRRVDGAMKASERRTGYWS